MTRLSLLLILVFACVQTSLSQCIPVPDQNTVIGTVFTDTNQDGINDGPGAFEFGVSGIDLDLYQDINGNGTVDAGDVIVDSATSAFDGSYTLIPTEITFSEDVADFFNKRKYDNDNGSEDWDSDWLEVGEFDGPRFGNVGVTSALRFGRNSFVDDFITGDGVYRIANLDTYTTATLSFDFRDFLSFTSVQYFSVYVQVSSDGITYTTLDTFTFGDTEQQYSYDISAFISATTHVRFVGDGFLQNSRSNYLYFDNITIDYEKEGYFPDYVVAVDDASIPNGTTLTTPTFRTVTFTDLGQISCDNDFGFFLCPSGDCAPEAVDDAAALGQGESITINVLVNDVAGNDNIDPGSVSVVSQPLYGSATVLPSGEIIYAPNGSYFGTDSFVYEVCDDNAFNPLCDTATVNLTITENVIDACLQAAQNHVYYIPFSDDDMRTAFGNSDSGFCSEALTNDVRRVTSIKSPYPGIVLIYDHWEDGYETDITNPVQSTTQVWGDNDPINGVAPGYPSDYIPSGGNFVLDDTYNYNPRNQLDIFYDGRDKIHTSADIALSTVAGDVNRFVVQAAKTDVFDTAKFGTSFTVPFGEDLGDEFSYTSLFIRASKNGTTVNVDLDNNGTIDSTANLAEGEVHFIDGGVDSGALITSNEPVGVDLFFGGLDCYGTRQINIYPSIFYADVYYSPVPTTESSAPAKVYFYNNNNVQIDIDWSSNSNTGTLPIAAKSSAELTLSDNSGYRFESQNGESYVASEVIDADSSGQLYDWAFNLISEERLTDFAAIAWAPGSNDNSVNYNPVWVTPVANTTLYVKFDGDLTSTTASMSPCGIPFDTSIAVNALNYTKIFDTFNNDNDQSGLAVYTCDGTKIFAVYGEDASLADTGITSPALDVGTSMQPLCLQPQVFANDDLAYGITDSSVNVSVLFNDTKFITNIDQSSVSTTAVIQPSNGSVSVNPDGTITYTPNFGYIGLDTFQYTVCSLEYPDVCDTANVTVNISDCPTPSNRNLVFGQAYIDVDNDGVNNDGVGLEGIQINIYEDLNANGVIDGGDLPLPTTPSTITDINGNYAFEVPSYDITIDDDFSSGNYSGGSTNWTGDWIEDGESNGPGSGDISIESGRLKVENNKIVYREVDLSDAVFATVSFNVFEEGSIDANDEVKVEICSDNTFTNCQILYFSADDFTNASISGAVIETDKLTATTHFRVEIDGYTSSDEEFFIDDVSIFATIRGKNLLMETEPTTVPSNYALSTDNIEIATFASGITGNCEKGNDFGFLGCSMTDPGLAFTCDDNGTPLDATDDTYTFTLNPDGLRFGANYTVSGDVTGTGVYGSPTVFGPFASTSGSKTITIADETGNCGLVDVVVDVPVSQCLSSSVPVSVDFDGVDDYIEVLTSQINTLDEFTLSFWIKPETLPSGTVFDSHFVMGQKDMFEIDLVPDGSGGANIHARHYYGVGGQANSIGVPITDQEWMHYTVAVNYNTQTIQPYVNGRPQTPTGMGGLKQNNINPFRIGSKEDTQPSPGDNFHGWLDEVRIFNSVLSHDQIQRMVYQEIENNAGMVKGSLINKDIVDGATDTKIPWTDLVTYFPMSDVANGKVIDKSAVADDGTLFNITTLLPQTAPMPYETVADGDWSQEGVWLHGDVWDIEDVANNKPWSVVHIKNDVSTSLSTTQLGMFIDADKTLTVLGDNAITNNWYLELNGTLDLQDDSQLIQTERSDLVTSATGKILRRQEGNADVYWYNYWSSPVGTLGATTLSDNNTGSNNANNTPFNIAMLKEGNGDPVTFTSDFDQVGQISDRWLYSFLNGQDYYDWIALTPASAISPGVGYTQKGAGVANVDGEQEYIFEGKPNNGTILVAADDIDGDDMGPGESVQDLTLTTTLVGNPYPSALDADEFIRDNIDFDNGGANPIIDGTILLWEQWAGSSHWLAEYEGGYGYINLTETARAYQHPDIPIAGQTQTQGIKTPTRFIPVGQGFFVEVIEDGNIEFNNSQRTFKQEGLGESVFFRNAESQENTMEEESDEPVMQTIKFEFAASNGATRRFVLGFSDHTTDGLDHGYDGGLITVSPEEDMTSIIDDKLYVIQALSPITPEKVIDLAYNASGNHNYSLEIVETKNIDETQEIYLRDNLTNTYFDLRESLPYSFTSDPGFFNERFDIVFRNDQTLDTHEIDDSNVLIYNNRVEHKLYVKGLKENVRSLTLTNMLGQAVKRLGSLDADTLEGGIFIGDLSTGVYMVNLITDNNVEMDKKILVE